MLIVLTGELLYSFQGLKSHNHNELYFLAYKASKQLNTLITLNVLSSNARKDVCLWQILIDICILMSRPSVPSSTNHFLHS